jgi:hypothetical protein
MQNGPVAEQDGEQPGPRLGSPPRSKLFNRLVDLALEFLADAGAA